MLVLVLMVMLVVMIMVVVVIMIASTPMAMTYVSLRLLASQLKKKASNNAINS